MEKTGLRIVLVSKVVGTVLVTLGLFYVGISTPSWALWGGLAWLVSLAAIHSVRDHNFKRDYASEPVTDAESLEGVVKILVEHLESTEHYEDECKPCPVPDLLSKIRFGPLKPDSPQEGQS